MGIDEFREPDWLVGTFHPGVQNHIVSGLYNSYTDGPNYYGKTDLLDSKGFLRRKILGVHVSSLILLTTTTHNSPLKRRLYNTVVYNVRNLVNGSKEFRKEE